MWSKLPGHSMHKRILGVILLAGVVSSAFPQQQLTLEECLQLGRTNSPALRAGEDAIRAAQLAQSAFSTTRLPFISLGLNASYAPIPPSFGYDPVISNGGQLAGQVIVRQFLFDGGARNVRGEQLRVEGERATHEHARAEQDLIFEVKTLYFTALRAQRELELRQESVEQLNAYLGLVQRIHAAGNASYTDVLKTEVQLSTARLDLQRSTESVHTARNSLVVLIGCEDDSSLQVAGSLDTLPEPAIPAVVDTPLSNSELGIAGLDVQRTALEVELTRRERFPEVSLVADAGYLSSFENLQLPASARVAGLGYAFGVGIELPIFNWGGTEKRIEQRERDLDVQRQQYEVVRRSVVAGIRNTRLSLTGARERLPILRANIAKAEDNFLLTKSTFAGGGALSLEVLSAQQLLTETRLAEITALTEIQLLTATLHHLTGQ
jgi:outer membrane protein